MRRRRRWLWVGGVFGALLILIVAAAFFIDEPLRRYMEREVNRSLLGYRTTITRLDFHPIGFSLDLEDVTLVQEANPDPPVAHFSVIAASVEWKQLFRGRVVADFKFKEPKLHVNRQHLQREAEDPVPIEKRGWQEALQAIYPLKINRFTIVDADLTYVDSEAKRLTERPLRLSKVNFEARNIRNIRSGDRVYPSDFELSAVVFENGRLAVDGQADFLGEPYPGVKAGVALETIRLDTVDPILRQYNIVLRKGVLAAAGVLEYGPQVTEVHLEHLTVDQLDGDFVYTGPTKKAEQVQQAAKATVKAADQASNHPDMLLKVDQLRVRDASFGFVNRAAKQPYRVFMADTNIEVQNFSNQLAEGTAVAKVNGRFMGTGTTVASATFRPQRSGPDFDVNVKIDDTDMRTMNDLLRAYGRFDVVAGKFSFYSELSVKDRTIAGYAKPLFRDMNVYDRRQDAEKGAFRKLYERVVEGVSKLLENTPRDEVATRADISGPMENPNANTWQVVGRLIQNAFFKAILPGFERQVARGGKDKDDGSRASASGRH